jgi:hypothetical protein
VLFAWLATQRITNMSSRVFVIVGIAGLLAAGIVGLLRMGPWSTSASSSWSDAIASAQALQDRAFQAYRSGGSTAVPALREYLAYLEGLEPLFETWEPGQAPWLNEPALASERMMVAGRLADALEVAGEHAVAARYWEMALSYARQSGRPDVSLESVRQAVSRPWLSSGATDDP